MCQNPRENDVSGARPTRAEPFRDLGQVEALRTASWNTSGVRLRAGVVDRLLVAQTLVPRAVRLLVIAGHQPPGTTGACQQAGHETGGAVDLTAYLDGSSEPACWCATPPPQWPAVADALRSVGMVNGDRWWHWSYGDNAWSVHNGGAAPCYPAPAETRATGDLRRSCSGQRDASPDAHFEKA